MPDLLASSSRQSRIFVRFTQSRVCRAAVDIDHGGEIRDPIGHGKCIQAFDKLRDEVGLRVLVDRGRIKQAIANPSLVPGQGRLSSLSYELAPTRFEEEQFRFRRHLMIFLGILQQM